MAVHFTKQQIDEIEQALIARSKRDSQFPGVDELDGTELIPIVQNGVNKIMAYSGLWNTVVADLQEYVEESLETKVDKVEGKGLSTNDFDDDYKAKLNGIESAAQVNIIEGVQVDGSDLPITNKKVNVVLSGKVDKVEGKGLSTEDYTTAEKTKVANAAVIDDDSVTGNIAVFDSSHNPVDGGMSLDGTLSPVVAAAFAKQQSEIDSLRVLLNDYQLKVKAESVDVMEYKLAGMPYILYSFAEGAPSASNVPANWDESTMNGWNGVPRFIGQIYLDRTNKKVYFAAAVTDSTGDWVELN